MELIGVLGCRLDWACHPSGPSCTTLRCVSRNARTQGRADAYSDARRLESRRIRGAMSRTESAGQAPRRVADGRPARRQGQHRHRRGVRDRPRDGDPVRRGRRPGHLRRHRPRRRRGDRARDRRRGVRGRVPTSPTPAAGQGLHGRDRRALGRAHVVFNNAGVNIPGVFHEAPDEVVDRTLDVNVKGCIYGCRYAIPHMLARRRRIADQHDLGQRARRGAVPRDLRHVQGRHRHALQGDRPRLREAGHPLQRDRAGLGRHARSTTPTRRCSAASSEVYADDRLVPADRPARRAARDRQRRALPRVGRVLVRHRLGHRRRRWDDRDASDPSHRGGLRDHERPRARRLGEAPRLAELEEHGPRRPDRHADRRDHRHAGPAHGQARPGPGVPRTASSTTAPTSAPTCSAPTWR